MSVKQRIYEFCHQKGISILGFERACGLSNGYVSSIHTSVGLRSLDLILSAFPELNREWLLYGTGEMINQNIVIPGAPVENSADSPKSKDPDAIVIPGAAWVVIQQQSASLERKDRQLDRCISMLETSFALLKGAAVPAAASAAAAGESAG